MKKYILFILAILFISTTGFGQKRTLPPSFAKGTIVVPKFSASLVDFKKFSVWTGRNSYGEVLRKNEDGIYTLGGRRDWKEVGWAIMSEFRVEKLNRDDGKWIFECRTVTDNIKLEIDQSVTDLEEGLKAAFFVGSLEEFKQSDYYQKEVVDKFLPLIFKDKLSSIPKDNQLRMIEGVLFKADAIKGETFKNLFYLVIDTGNDDVIYNTIQVNQSERTTRTVEKIINAGLNQATILGDYPDIQGLKLIVKVGYADFLREGQYAAHQDEIQAYFPLEVLKQYKEADITNQQLVDKSYIFVNGNRVQVVLTQFK